MPMTSLIRAVWLGGRTGLLDPILVESFGKKPYAGPCAIGHECVAEVVEIGPAVTTVAVGDKVIVPWSVSCGQCENCRRGLTLKCTVSRYESGREQPVVCYGLGPVSGSYGDGTYGGMISDFIRVPYANHMLARLPDGLDPLRVAAASDSLVDGWRCVIPHLREQPGAKVLVVGGMARAIGLYAAGIAATHGASVDYLDSSSQALTIAESLGAQPVQRRGILRFPKPHEAYDIVVDASNVPTGITHAVRSTAPGGICVVPSYHMALVTGVPLMHMTFTSITLHVSTTNAAAVLPEVLTWVHDNDFPAEKVTPEVSDWSEAPTVYATKSMEKPVLYRSPLT
ncbi:alcohol dehydrogenase catalytic domain-containing protein [Mycobacteroides abscessus]|uniref:alcohol dehydrogenase catalytic domain-containing protein n=1 Tax=Mycobacteroides abscessus TaxID=36809 RepID=UPI00373FDA9D